MKRRTALVVVLLSLCVLSSSVNAQEEGLQGETVLQEEPQADETRQPDIQQFQAPQEVKEEIAPAEPDQETAEFEAAPAEEALLQETVPQDVKEGSAQAEPVEKTEEVAATPGEDSMETDVQAQKESPEGRAVGLKEAPVPERVEDEAQDAARKEESGRKDDSKKSALKGDDQKQDLLDRIEELEKRINELTEESRARRKLEVTEQEKQEKEKDVLEAVGREYSLDAKHSLGLDYTLSYGYSPSNRIANQLIIDKEADHTIRHIISTTYGVQDNLSVSTSLPFVYRYNKLGTSEEIDETDIGDIFLGVNYQPWKSKIGDITKTFSLNVVLPTGRSPYEINPETELSTGDGVLALSAGGSFSMQIDPVVAFWNASYTYKFDATGINHTMGEGYVLEKVKTGNAWGVGAGLAYAMSYKVSVNASINYSYSYSSDYYYRYATKPLSSGDDVSATFGLGMGWKISNKTTLSFSLGYGLTETGFSLSVRVPFTFML